MHLKVIRKDEIKIKTNRRGIKARSLVDQNSVGIMNLILEPGDKVPEHSVPVDVFFYLSGVTKTPTSISGRALPSFIMLRMEEASISESTASSAAKLRNKCD